MLATEPDGCLERKKACQWMYEHLGVSKIFEEVRAGHAWLSPSAWNSLVHAIHGNTVAATTTKTTYTRTTTDEEADSPPISIPQPKAKAKAKAKAESKPKPTAKSKSVKIRSRNRCMINNPV